MGVISCRTDNDLYKLTMGQVVFHHFNNAYVKYEFKNRSKGIDLSPYADEIESEIKAYCNLSFTEEELLYLHRFSYFDSNYINSLMNLNLNYDNVVVNVDKNQLPENRLSIHIEGRWINTIELEVPILAIINQIYFKYHSKSINDDWATGDYKLKNKINEIIYHDKPINLIEFGTRRRYSAEWQDHVVSQLNDSVSMVKTSNIYLSKKHNIPLVGTMAHEYLQACQAFAPLHSFQKFALDLWMNEFRGELGIALTDVISMDAFLNDFDKLFCKAYDGVRHDSGSPYTWCDKLLKHYEKMGINPLTKTAIFSDGLTITNVIQLSNQYHNRIQMAFGVGTHLTNDLNADPLQIVIKMVECNGMPVAKISDNPSKCMCSNKEYIAYLKSIYHAPVNEISKFIEYA